MLCIGCGSLGGHGPATVERFAVLNLCPACARDTFRRPSSIRQVAELLGHADGRGDDLPKGEVRPRRFDDFLTFALRKKSHARS